MPLRSLLFAGCLLALACSSGCQSPYHADRGAAVRRSHRRVALGVVGSASGNTGAGAAIGAGVGGDAVAAVGGSLDEIEARNRAEIEAGLRHPITPGGVTIPDVIAMTQAGVSDDVIATHIRYHGVAQPLQTGDLIQLQNNNVSPRVVQAMQQPPLQGPVVVQQGPPPVIVQEHYYGPPHGYYRHYHRPCPPPVRLGFSYHHH